MMSNAFFIRLRKLIQRITQIQELGFPRGIVYAVVIGNSIDGSIGCSCQAFQFIVNPAFT